MNIYKEMPKQSLEEEIQNLLTAFQEGLVTLEQFISMLSSLVGLNVDAKVMISNKLEA